MEERKALFWKCWDQIPNPEWYLSRWFPGAKIWEIKRDNVAEFYRWALLNQGDESIPKAGTGVVAGDVGEEISEENRARNAQQKQEEQEEVDEYVDGMQTLLGRRLEPGRGTAQSLRLTTNKVDMLHRPFLWYLV